MGVDINPWKVEMVGSGRSPIIEPGLNELLKQGIEANRIHTTTDSEKAVHESDVSFICVGTPSRENGSLNLDHVKSVCRDIGKALATRSGYHLVVVRSTVLPGTVLEQLLPILVSSSKKEVGKDFGLAMNPEFMREGSAIKDYYNPGHIVIGEFDTRSGDILQELYASLEANLIRTTIPTAETVKYANNAFHALKVTFANEIGALCKAHGIDGQEVMNIFCQDHRLNLSAYYLRPGFAFGGSCLPKDVRALLYRAKERDIDCPVLNAVIPSNQQHIQRGIAMIERTNCKKIGVLGMSFKSGTDDVRESPIITLIETLIGRGYDMHIYDENVIPDRLIGANKAFLERELPHIASLMHPSVEEMLQHIDVAVLTNNSPTFDSIPSMLRPEQILIDLSGTLKNTMRGQKTYEGICW
jgi:GDP-mannose 6-dehydrogenase